MRFLTSTLAGTAGMRSKVSLQCSISLTATSCRDRRGRGLCGWWQYAQVPGVLHGHLFLIGENLPEVDATNGGRDKRHGPTVEGEAAVLEGSRETFVELEDYPARTVSLSAFSVNFLKSSRSRW